MSIKQITPVKIPSHIVNRNTGEIHQVIHATIIGDSLILKIPKTCVVFDKNENTFYNSEWIFNYKMAKTYLTEINQEILKLKTDIKRLEAIKDRISTGLENTSMELIDMVPNKTVLTLKRKTKRMSQEAVIKFLFE